MSKFKDGRVRFRNSGLKGLILNGPFLLAGAPGRVFISLISSFVVPALFEEKRGYIIFGFPWCVVPSL